MDEAISTYHKPPSRKQTAKQKSAQHIIWSHKINNTFILKLKSKIV